MNIDFFVTLLIVLIALLFLVKSFIGKIKLFIKLSQSNNFSNTSCSTCPFNKQCNKTEVKK